LAREGDAVYAAPYRATQADLNAYLLEADVETLNELVDVELNRCVASSGLLGSLEGLQFECVDPWVIFIYAALRSFSSVAEADAGRGYMTAFELSIWVPMLKRQTIAGGVISEAAWFLPLVYTAPTSSVVTGREVFGFPKIPAYLELPATGGPPVALRQRYEIDRNRTSGELRFRAPELKVSGSESTLADAPFLSSAVLRFFANHPLVFRKQAGIVDKEIGLETRYQALVESRVPISRISELRWVKRPGKITDVPQAVSSGLGLNGTAPEPQFGIAVRDCTVDVQHGREIWVSRTRSAYIRPTLIQEADELPSSVSAFSISAESNDALAHALDGTLEKTSVFSGVGELFIASVLPGAIASLLHRDFPRHLRARPLEPDADRNFVVISLIRASRSAKIRLYELAVWVPIRCGSSAKRSNDWYIPYLFRSPGVAVVHARERFGHPCQEAFIKFEGADDERSVQFRRPLAGVGPVEWKPRDGIILGPVLGKAAPDVNLLPYQRPVSLRVVGLRQVRHVADTSRACLQELVASTIEVAADVTPKPELWKLTWPGVPGLDRLLVAQGHAATVCGYNLGNLTLNVKGSGEWTT
jgi:hypothetical protein